MPERIARRNLLPVPPGLAPEVAAIAEPLACCLHGIDMAGVRRGDTVAIVGLGPIGLMLCACAADAGGHPVGVGSREERRALDRLLRCRRRRSRGGRRGHRGSRNGRGLGACARARPTGRYRAGLRRAAARDAGRGRPLSDPLRGGPPRRLLPSHPAPLPRRARVPRERGVSVRAPVTHRSGSRASPRCSTPRRADYLKAAVRP